MRSSVWISDLVRALGYLQPRKAADKKVIAALLGLNVRASEAPAPNPAAGRVRGRIEDEFSDEPKRVPPPAAPASVPHDETSIHVRVARRSPRKRKVRVSVNTVPAIQADSATRVESFPLQPILRPAWTRGVLSGMLATRKQSHRVDVDRVVLQTARGEALRRLPMLQEVGVQHGAQVLIDCGEGMTPFMRDADDIVQKIELLLGAERVAVVRFTGTPLLSCRGAGSLKQRVYRPPAAGSAVIALTDLGIGDAPPTDKASVHDWAKFAALLQRSACPLSALVPYPPVRLPPGLPAYLQIIQWHEGTGIRSVRRALSSGG